MPDPISGSIIGAGVLGAGASILGSNKAASAQTKAASNATDAQRQMFDITRQGLAPYNTAGQNATDILNGRINQFTNPADFHLPTDQASLEATPGYQFNLSQGLKAAQNSAAARGLGTSGAAFKGAERFASGLADSTYQNQVSNAQQTFNNQITNQTNSYNRLLELAGLGENAAAGVGNAATATGTNIGNNIIGAGNAQGAAAISQGNGIANAAQSIPNGLLTQQLLKNGIYGNGANSSYAPYDFNANQSSFDV
jgi:hypothetical protein